MRFLVSPICFLAVICTPLAAGQHGTAEGGYYSSNYHGDIWTGTLTAIDHEKDSITLTYEHKGKSETFTGVFKHPLEVVDEDGHPSKVRIHLQTGDRITAYYIVQGPKDSKENLIFRIKLLPPDNKH